MRARHRRRSPLLAADVKTQRKCGLGYDGGAMSQCEFERRRTRRKLARASRRANRR